MKNGVQARRDCGNNQLLIRQIINASPIIAGFYDGRLSVEELERNTVSDAPLRYFLRDRSGKLRWVMALANPDFPDAVASWAARGRAVARILDPEMSGTIVLPVEEGRADGRSYAIWKPHKRWSDNRYLRMAQQMASAGHVTEWLADLARQTANRDAAPAAHSEMMTALIYLEGETGFSDIFRRRIDRLLRQADQRGDLVQVAQHGDFWYGNVLQKKTPGMPGTSLRVIDWGTGRVNGHPFVDLLTFISSLPGPLRSLHKWMWHQYARAAGLKPHDAPLYLAASLGHLGLNLEQFPKGRYLQMAGRRFDLLDRLQPMAA